MEVIVRVTRGEPTESCSVCWKLEFQVDYKDYHQYLMLENSESQNCNRPCNFFTFYPGCGRSCCPIPRFTGCSRPWLMEWTSHSTRPECTLKIHGFAQLPRDSCRFCIRRNTICITQVPNCQTPLSIKFGSVYTSRRETISSLSGSSTASISARCCPPTSTSWARLCRHTCRHSSTPRGTPTSHPRRRPCWIPPWSKHMVS